MENNFFTTRDGINLNYTIDSTNHETWLIHTHGVGEYQGRHKYVHENFGGKINVFQYDLRGHGKSGGKRAFVTDFFDYVRDLEEIINFLVSKHKMKKYILMGHSMGGLITAAYIQNFASTNLYPYKVVLSAPPVGVGGPLQDLAKKLPYGLVSAMASIPCSIAIPGLVDLKVLSHDPQVAIDYAQDPLNCTKLHLKLGIEILKASKEVFSKPLNIKCEGHIVIGTHDQVVNYQMVKEYFSTIEKGLSYHEYDGAFHEIHNEISLYKDSYFKFLDTILS